MGHPRVLPWKGLEVLLPLEVVTAPTTETPVHLMCVEPLHERRELGSAGTHLIPVTLPRRQ